MMTKYETGRLSAKGVVAIPKNVRNILGIGEGDKLEFEQVTLRELLGIKEVDQPALDQILEQLIDEIVVVRGVKKKSVWDAFGSLDIDFTRPLVDVRDVRDQYREGLIADDLHRQDD
jgi:looped-hinge helix DNA binding domain, AbrB family